MGELQPIRKRALLWCFVAFVCFVVIKTAFKVGEVVVWDRNLYTQEAYIQLNNPTYYHKPNTPSLSANPK